MQDAREGSIAPAKGWSPILLAIAASALLAMAPGQAMAANTIGDTLTTFGANMIGPFGKLVVGACFLLGFWLIGTGLLNWREAGNDRGNASFMTGGKKITFGAFMVALPDAVGAGIGTFFGTTTGHAFASGNATVTTVRQCMSTDMTGTSTTTITCMMDNFTGNVVAVGLETFFACLFVMGVGTLGFSLYTLATSHSTGRHQLPRGMGMKMFAGVIACNLPLFFSSAQTTLSMGNGTIDANGFSSTSSLLAYAATPGNAVLTGYSSMMVDLFKLCVLLGVIAVWRGVVFLRAYAEGNQNGGYGTGLMHILGGVMLANLKGTICIGAMTLTGAGFGFC